MGFRPSKAVEGSGVDFDGTIISARTGAFTYQSGEESVGFILQIRDDDTGQLRKFTDNYSAGRPTVVQPTENGLGLRFAREDKQGDVFELNKNSKAGQFMARAAEAGLAESEMQVDGDENNILFLVGLRFHFALGESSTVGGSSKSIFPTKFLGRASVPAEFQGKTAAAPAPAATQSDEEVAELARNLVVEVVIESGNSISLTKLSNAVLKKVEDQKLKTRVARAMLAPGFRSTIDGLKDDGKTVSL